MNDAPPKSKGWLTARFREQSEKVALRWKGTGLTYGELSEKIEEKLREFAEAGVAAGDVVFLEGDYEPAGIGALLALAEARAIVVPCSDASEARREELVSLSGANWRVRAVEQEKHGIERLGKSPIAEPIRILRERRHAGLMLFTSGSTGQSKGIVHDLEMLLEKFQARRRDFSTVAFLLFDHIGGLDTLFYCLSNLSTVLAVPTRSVEDVCGVIEKERAEVLPTSPTFLNLLLLAGAHKSHDLSSLRIITYGAELMPPALLQKCAEAFPKVELIQKYGASEVGALRSKSRERDSVWVKLGGEGVGIRVVNGELQIKTRSAMVGYLNAPSPFTEDGWFKTGDQVETDGEWLRILGRASDVINVGGDKVFPGEVESVIMQMEGVQEVSVRGEASAILGHQVVAEVVLAQPEPINRFRARLVQFCKGRLENFKIPQKIIVSDGPLHSDRFKVLRRQTS